MDKYRVYFDSFFSLLVAMIAYYLLGSTGIVEHEGFKITGGITVYFLNFILMNRFYKENIQSPLGKALQKHE